MTTVINLSQLNCDYSNAYLKVNSAIIYNKVSCRKLMQKFDQIFHNVVLTDKFHCLCYTHAVCPVNSQKFLSIDRDLLPESNVRASSEDTSFNPVENFITSDSQTNPPWCTEPDVTDPQDHYVEVNFTEPVVITFLESSGFFNGFVSKFIIEYVSVDDPNDRHLYGVLESPQVSHT